MIKKKKIGKQFFLNSFDVNEIIFQVILNKKTCYVKHYHEKANLHVCKYKV